MAWQLSEETKERISNLIDYSRLAIHYGYLPLIMVHTQQPKANPHPIDIATGRVDIQGGASDIRSTSKCCINVYYERGPTIGELFQGRGNTLKVIDRVRKFGAECRLKKHFNSYKSLFSLANLVMSEQSQQLPQSLVESIAGFIAGVTSTCVSHPLDIVKTRLQLQVGQAASPFAFGNSLRIIRGVAQDEGLLRGFYRGLTPNVIGNSVSWAIYFVLYDRIKRGIHTYEGPGTSLSYYDYFLASGTAGALTALFTNPIWVIKTRMLSTSANHPGAYTSIVDGTRQIYKSEGIPGFYRGLVPSLFGVTHGAIQFMAYEQLKIHRARSLLGGRKDLSAGDYLMLSGLAKVIAGSSTYPYQVIRARLQMYDADSTYKSARDVVGQMWKKEGLRGFYKGLGPNLLRVLPSTWVTFLVYEKTKIHLPKLVEKEHSG